MNKFFSATSKITYHEEKGFLIPDIAPDNQAEELGKWGNEWIEYMKVSHNALMQSYLMSGKLTSMAVEIQKACEEMEERMVNYHREQLNITEKLKEEDPLEWARRMKEADVLAKQAVREEMFN